MWEGGHHVPLIIKWPGHVKGNSVSDEVVSQIDIMATLASITGIELPENAAPDSYNFTSVIKGEEYQSPFREAIIHNTYASKWGIRKGDWLYINDATGGHRKLPKSFKKLRRYIDFNTAGILFNMKTDPEQRVNLYNKNSERVLEMDSLIQVYRKNSSSLVLNNN